MQNASRLDHRDEPQLAARARDGDRLAFATLVRRHAPAIFGFLLRWPGDRSLAEDAFQEATVRAFRAIGRLDPQRPFRAWLLRIAINRARSAARRQARARDVVVRAGAIALEPGAAPDAQARLESRNTLARALALLSPDDRQVLLLRYVLDLDRAELSRVLGRPGLVVAMRLSRARSRFRERVRALDNEVDSALPPAEPPTGAATAVPGLQAARLEIEVPSPPQPPRRSSGGIEP